MMNNNLLDTSHDGQLNLIFGAPNGAVGDTPLLAGFSDTMLQIQAVLTRLADGAIDPDQRNAYEEQYMLLANQKSDFVLDAIRYSDRIPLILHAADESSVNQTLLYGGFDTAGPIRALLTRLADGAIDSSQRTTFIEQYSILANQASDFVLDAIHNRRFDLIFDAPLLVDFSDNLRQIQAVLTRLADGAIDSDQRNTYEEQYMLLANQKSDFVLDAIRYSDRIPLILHAADESYVNQTLLYGGFDTAGPIRALLTRLADGAIDSSQRTTFIEQYSILANQASDFVLDAIHNRRFDLIFDAPLLVDSSDNLRQIQAVLTRLADGAIDSDQRNTYEEQYMLLANQKSDFVLDAIRYSDRIPLILHAADESYVNQTLLYGGFDTAGPIRALLTRLADGAIDSNQRTTFIEQYSILANQASDFVVDAIHNRRFDLIFDAPGAPPAPIPKTLLGGDGADTLIGDDGDDTLAGGAGDDLLEARGGQNQASGGDRFFGDAGDDLLEVIGGAFSLSGGAGADTLSVWEDWVANDVLNGGDGADSLNAGAGDDTLIGGAGADTMIGGAGDDVILAGGTSLQDIMSLFTL